jgi:UDP-N-acetylmuramyl tripeptide synthase
MIRPVNTHMNYHATTKAEQLDAIKADREESKQKQFTQIISQIQSTLVQKSEDDRVEVNAQSFKEFLNDIGYTGKPIASLSAEEATELVSEDGFFRCCTDL